ncbi:metallophosphoesterase [Sphingomonas sp.]|uniref:metallophosphoesterase family protein n=1 Tax=Sphingomonas sp. TaxID=28214 RepID=UPI002B94C66B|nr:metallophosphoesterase [Sphingomonas sp.]HWK36696.1 metallophosphoesterase [Sphingomonas sp.]
MIRLFHVSDVHFGREDTAAIDWFDALVRSEVPDAIIMTGDLTMRARAREFAAAATWLEALGRPVTVEVGNHDLPYFNLAARFLTPYRRYLALERMIERPLDIHGVAVVPLRTTARFQWRLNWSKGHVSRGELAKALALARTVPPGGVTLLACHHPLIEGGTHMHARTRGGGAALAALAAAGVDAVLTGHVHDPFDLAWPVAGRTVRLIGAGTLSERTRTTRPSFNELRIDGRAIDVRVRTMDAVVPPAEAEA